MNETPDKVHGRLAESVYYHGHSFERACRELEWLLEEDRWKLCAGGFERIDDFLATINFSDIKVPIEQRKKIANKLDDLRATQRAIAGALGVGRSTVNRDLESVPNGTKHQQHTISLELSLDLLRKSTKKQIGSDFSLFWVKNLAYCHQHRLEQEYLCR